jgi:hypothetical protein
MKLIPDWIDQRQVGSLTRHAVLYNFSFFLLTFLLALHEQRIEREAKVAV